MCTMKSSWQIHITPWHVRVGPWHFLHLVQIRRWNRFDRFTCAPWHVLFCMSSLDHPSFAHTGPAWFESLCRLQTNAGTRFTYWSKIVEPTGAKDGGCTFLLRASELPAFSLQARTLHMCIHLCTMKCVCRLHYLSPLQIHRCNRFTCAPWNASMKCFWHLSDIPYAHWHGHHEIFRPQQIWHLLCSSSLQIHMWTRFTCAPWNVSDTDSHVHHDICIMMLTPWPLPTPALPHWRDCVDCKWTISTTFTCAPWKFSDTHSHVHHEICTMTCFSHSFARTPWRPYAIPDFADICAPWRGLTHNLRIDMCTMQSWCRSKLCFCIVHHRSKITCVPGSHVHHEKLLAQIHMCTLKWFWHRFVCAPWNSYDVDSHVQHEICTMPCFSHSFACAPWALYALTHFAYSFSSHWKNHMCTMTCVWHFICALTCAPWNQYVVCMINHRSNFTGAPGPHVHHETFLTQIQMRTTKSVPCNASHTSSHVHHDICMP